MKNHKSFNFILQRGTTLIILLFACLTCYLIGCEKNSLVKVPPKTKENITSTDVQKSKKNSHGTDSTQSSNLRIALTASPLTPNTDGTYSCNYGGYDIIINVIAIPNQICTAATYVGQIIKIAGIDNPVTIVDDNHTFMITVTSPEFIDLEKYSSERNAFYQAADSAGMGLRNYPLWDNYVKGDFITGSASTIIYGKYVVVRQNNTNTLYLTDPNYPIEVCPTY